MKQIASILKSVFEKRNKIRMKKPHFYTSKCKNTYLAALQCWAPGFFHCTHASKHMTDLVSMQRTLAVGLRT